MRDLEKARAAQRRWRLKHKDEIRERRRGYMQQWARKNAAAVAEYRHNYYQQNKPKLLVQARAYRLKRIGFLDFAKQLADQGGRCGLCSKVMTITRADHNHETGQGRSILCHQCNLGLGMFKDNPALLRRAAEYLESHSTSEPK